MDITNPIHLMNQNLRTTDSPIFADIQVPTNYVIAGDTNFYGLATETSVSGVGTSAFDKSVVCPCAGGFRCVATVASGYFSATTYTYMSIVTYKNGSEVFRYDQTVANTPETKTYDVTFAKGDIIRHRIYVRAQGGSGPYSPRYGKDMFFNSNHAKDLSSLYDNMFVFY
jgi:hypothetical protein